MGQLTGLAATVGLLALVVLAVLTVLIPVMIYSGQRSAHLAYRELERLNGQIGQLLDEVVAQRHVGRLLTERGEASGAVGRIGGGQGGGT